jgi:hypothetical protein
MKIVLNAYVPNEKRKVIGLNKNNFYSQTGVRIETAKTAGFCGSWLACESLDAVHQKLRISFFAGKPAPTELVRDWL